MPRTMIVVAHPDDEVIAMGARIQRFRGAHFVHATDGTPQNEQDSRHYGFVTLDAYRKARAQEFRNALREAEMPGVSYECLGIPDQEACLNLAALVRMISTLIARHSPEVVLTHPYEGGHPDHDACAFAVHQATRELATHAIQPPLILEAGFYHAGFSGIETGCFLSNAEPGNEIAYNLAGQEQRQKQRLLQCFTTQQTTLQYFSTAQERFRIAPRYDFTRLPHHPPVFYDQYPWGMRSGRFCDLATKAMQTMEERAISQ